MFVHLSHILDPDGPHYPTSPTLTTEPHAVIGQGSDSNDVISQLPNHFGTHMDAPRHFNPDGLTFAELPTERFNFDGDEILLIDVPAKGEPRSIVTVEDVEGEDFNGIRMLLIRTGFERFRDTDLETYMNEGPCLDPKLCEWLATETGVECVGMDWLSVAAPWNDLGTEAHRQLLGYYRDNFVTAIEDLSLAPVGDNWIDFLTLGGLRIKGIDSSQVSVTAFLNDLDFLDDLDGRDGPDAEEASFDGVVRDPNAPAPAAEDEP